MSGLPKISVLLCCFNYDQYVSESIQSVLDQTYDNLELLIVDDCSTDNSAEVIKKFSDPRIIFVQNKENLGFMGSRNKLLNMVDTDYVAFQDADDVWLPTKLEMQMKYMLANPDCAACFTSADLINENSEIYTNNDKCDIALDTFNKKASTHAEVIRHFFYEGNFISHPSALIKKCILDEMGPFNKRLIQLQDYDYWCRIGAKYNICVLDDILMHVRRISDHHLGLSASEMADIRTKNELVEVMRDLFDNMTLEVFSKAFENDIIYNPASSDELVCEKYFLLLKWECCGWNNKLPALQFFNENFSPEIEYVLNNKYNYTLKDYYKETGEMLYLYPVFLYKEFKDLHTHANNLEQIINNKNSRIDMLIRQIDIQNGQIDALSKQIENIYNSKSWKLTKPLRKLRKSK